MLSIRYNCLLVRRPSKTLSCHSCQVQLTFTKLPSTVTCSKCNTMPVGCPSEYWKHLYLNLSDGLWELLFFQDHPPQKRQKFPFGQEYWIPNIQKMDICIYILFLVATCLCPEWRDGVNYLGLFYYQRNNHCWKLSLERRFQFNGM